MTERKGQAPLRNPYQPPNPYVYCGPCITALRSTHASARAAMCIGWIVSTRLTPPSLAVTSLVGDVFDLSAADEALHCWVQWRIQGTLGCVYVWGWGEGETSGVKGKEQSWWWSLKKKLTRRRTNLIRKVFYCGRGQCQRRVPKSCWLLIVNFLSFFLLFCFLKGFGILTFAICQFTIY